MQKTPSFAAKEAYQFMVKNSEKVDGVWLSEALALMTWVNKSEAVALMRELSDCGLLKMKFDSPDGCGGTLVEGEEPRTE